MKSTTTRIHHITQNKIALALCTAVALSTAMLLADDDKAKGAPGPDNAKSTGKSSQLSRSDENFIKDACRGSHMEVQMGKLGLQKAQSTEVKQFSQRLIDDHTKAGTELKQLAASKGVAVPDQEKIAGNANDADRTQVKEKTDDDDSKGHAEMKKLEGLSGTEFDRAFAKMAVKDHEKDVKAFEKASKNADDAEVKAFAAKTLPTLQAHLEQAKTLQTSSGK